MNSNPLSIVLNEMDGGLHGAMIPQFASDSAVDVQAGLTEVVGRTAVEMGVEDRLKDLIQFGLKHRARSNREMSPIAALVFMLHGIASYTSLLAEKPEIREALESFEDGITWQVAGALGVRSLAFPVASALTGDAPFVYLTDSQALALRHTIPADAPRDEVFPFPNLPIFVLPPHNCLATPDDEGLGMWVPRVVAPVRLTEERRSEVIFYENANDGRLLTAGPPEIMGRWGFMEHMSDFVSSALGAVSILGTIDVQPSEHQEPLPKNRSARRREERERSKRAAVKNAEAALQIPISRRVLDDRRKIVSVRHERCEGTGRTVAPHWRKGHQRMVPYGPMDIEPRPTRPVMVGPVIVNAHLGQPTSVVSYRSKR